VLLAIDEMSTSYERVLALQNVSLTADKGKIVCIIGANGAGKSTLLKCISGIILPDKGRIFFEGDDITNLSSHQIVRKGIAYVPEGRQIFAPLKVIENLKLGAYHYYKRENKNEINKLMELIFHTFPVLKERRNQIAGTCSGGEQQMLAIGRALMSKPKLLLLDEPSLGLSPLVIQEIFKVLDELYYQGLTILLVEQNAQIALSFAHYGYVLKVGKVVLEGNSNELLHNEAIIASYLGG
jgi:branched-chain amino acid transport system ATP-binding protein